MCPDCNRSLCTCDVIPPTSLKQVVLGALIVCGIIYVGAFMSAVWAP